MIYTLTLNPAFDLHYEMEKFVPFSENYVKKAVKSSGGKGINVSKALCALDCENEALIVTGRENGAEFLCGLESLRFKVFETEGRIRENITIHPKEGKETRISLDNFFVPVEILEKIEEYLIPRCNEKNVLVFAGRLPKGISKERAIELLQKVRLTGARIALDSNSFGPEDLKKVRPWLIKPNETEISAFFGCSVKDYEKAADALRELGVENVMISLGEDGICYSGKDACFLTKAPKITPVSTIGAGDSTIAGFIAGYEKGLSVKNILRLAVSAGSAACLAEGTAPPKKEDIERLFAKIPG